MTKRFFWLLGGLGISFIFFFLILGCRKNSTSSNQTPPPVANQVLIQDNFFQPDSLEVDSGATVTWTNRGNALHTVTSDSSGYFNSANLSTNQSFAFTFQNKGSFGYHCSIHPSMKAKIVVK